MNKDKIKTIGQLILDVLTAIWLVVLSFLGSSCLASGGNLTSSINAAVEFDPQPIIEEVE